jgi:arylsulfatase
MISRRAFVGSAIAAASQAQAPKPNVVMIYCDDLGYGDLGCYGGRIATPNIDRMAGEGIRFTQWTSANPLCSPSRAALLTGRYPTRVNVPRVLNPFDKEGLPDGEQTLAQLLKPSGYKTMCVGKWHLGHLPPYLPTNRGFDDYFGIPYSNDMSPKTNPTPTYRRPDAPPLPVIRGTKVIEEEPDQRYLTKRYTEESIRFIEASKNDPFFLYLPHNMPHSPVFASERFRGKSPLGLYGDVISELDWSVGEILSTLKKNGLDGRTLVMFSSDNGPWFEGSPGRLRGRKGMTWEGGVRVPFIARMPGRIPGGRVSDQVGSMMDVFPSVAKLCGVMPAKQPDGIDLWPVLGGASREIDREALLYFDQWNLQCARWKNWKLHLMRWNTDFYSQGKRVSAILPAPELYDLAQDPDESYNMAGDRPQVVKDLVARVEKILPTFPEPVQKAWADAKAVESWETRPGANPKVAGM